MATLFELPRATCTDVAFVLRAIADQIDAGTYGTVQMGALVLETTDGGVHVFGAGGADYYRGIALLHLGLENLMSKRGRECMR